MNLKLKMKYTNIDLPEFPSKYTLFKKVKKRVKAFDLLMNRLMDYAKLDTRIQHHLIQLIFAFLKPSKNKKRKSSNCEITNSEISQ